MEIIIVSKPNKALSAQFFDHILIQYFPYYTHNGALNTKMYTFTKDMSFLLNQNVTHKTSIAWDCVH